MKLYFLHGTTSSADFSRVLSMNRSIDSPFGQRMRPPRVIHISFTRSFQIYYCKFAGSLWASSSNAELPFLQQPYIWFLFVTTLFRHRLLSDSTSQWTPLPRLAIPTSSASRGLSPPRYVPCLAHIFRTPFQGFEPRRQFYPGRFAKNANLPGLQKKYCAYGAFDS